MLIQIEKKMFSTSVFFLPFVRHVPLLAQQWAHIFLRFPFVTYVLTEALLVAFYIPDQIQFHLISSLLNLDSVSVSLPC